MRTVCAALRRGQAVLWTLWMFVGLRWGVRLAADWPEEGPSNCYLWALQQQQRQGGTLLLVDSRYGPWKHCRWIRCDGQQWEFNPPEKHRRRLPPPLFEGTAQEWRG